MVVDFNGATRHFDPTWAMFTLDPCCIRMYETAAYASSLPSTNVCSSVFVWSYESIVLRKHRGMCTCSGMCTVGPRFHVNFVDGIIPVLSAAPNVLEEYLKMKSVVVKMPVRIEY